ncbi:hypothetical protein [Pseudomonas japonica]|uniref:hypothetical protein n=1 Tax=Pseudomonas japonica TaxID=256466 RepID=UPI0014838D81|nr:hypothetical protein [Pseudomonas japonica]
MTISVSVPYQQPVISPNPTCGFGKTIAVMIEIHARTQTLRFNAVAIEIQNQRRNCLLGRIEGIVDQGQTGKSGIGEALAELCP